MRHSPSISERPPAPHRSPQVLPIQPAPSREARTSLVGRLAAIAVALGTPVVTLGTLAHFDFADAYPMLLAVLISAASAFLIALAWPGGWMWGLRVASGFGLMLIAAFLGLLKIGRADPRPVIDVWVVTAVSCTAAAIGGRLRTWARRLPHTSTPPR
jgi:hypothetical protein